MCVRHATHLAMRLLLLLAVAAATAVMADKRHPHHAAPTMPVPTGPVPTSAPTISTTDAPWPAALRHYVAEIYYGKAKYDYYAASTALSAAEAANALANAKADEAYAESLEE